MRKPFGLREAYRAVPDFISNAQILPELTQLVLSTAGESEDPNYAFADDIFDVVPTGHYNIRIPTRFGEYMVRRDTLREARSDMGFVDRQYGFTDRTMKRNTLAGLVDDDEMKNADPWTVSADAAADARDIVQLDLALTKKDTILNVNNYGAHYAILAGQGFNLSNGLHLQDVVTQAVHVIMQATGVGRNRLKMVLLGQLALDAAILDFELRNRAMYTTAPVYASTERIKDYLGIASISAYAPIYRTDAINGTPQEMFPGGAIWLGYPGQKATLPRGGIVWARTFRMGGTGGALPPFRIDEKTSMAYPWQIREQTEVFNTGAAVLITNPWQDS